MRRFFLICASITLVLCARLQSQNVIIVVLDGARYSETFGSGDKYLKNIWTILRPQGTIFTNFRNEGITKTVPGHSSIETGTWQKLPNDGTKRPTMPTVFEYNRKERHSPEKQNYVVSGKAKLEVLAYSTHPEYGKNYGAAVSVADGDRSVLDSVLAHMQSDHPSLMVINFPQIDKAGHKGKWKKYLHAIVRADALVGQLWNAVQSNPSYMNTTTLIVTNDHGRHDDAHGGFDNHGDDCEGCRHIMLLMIGRDIPAGAVDTLHTTQIDIAPTVGKLLGFTTAYASGKSLLPIPQAEQQAK